MSDLPERLRRNHSPDYLRVYKDSCTCQYCRSAREIESLQRELAEKHDEVLALEAAAITPEMRERIGAHRARLENPNTQLRQWTLAADQIFSDLLGEQG